MPPDATQFQRPLYRAAGFRRMPWQQQPAFPAQQSAAGWLAGAGVASAAPAGVPGAPVQAPAVATAPTGPAPMAPGLAAAVHAQRVNANPRFAALYAPPAPGMAPPPSPALAVPVAQSAIAPGAVLAAPAQTPVAVIAPPAQVAPAAPSAAPPMPAGGAWGDQAHLDYFRQYGPGNSGLSQEQVDSLLGKPPAPPSAATAAFNQQQQQFTANNQGYAATGYQGNASQVASQVAHGAQASSIPLGVLDSSFWQGGTNYGGAQNDQNIASGNNGATNWNDPSVSGFGVDQAIPGAVVSGVANLRNALTASQAQATTGGIGRAVTFLPAVYAGYQAQLQQAASNPGFSGTLPPAPVQQQAQTAPIQRRPVDQGAQVTGPGSVIASLGIPNIANHMGNLQEAAANA